MKGDIEKHGGFEGVVAELNHGGRVSMAFEQERKMSLLDFLTGKSKKRARPGSAPPSTTAAPAEELKKEIAKHGLDASKIDVKVEGGKVTLSGSAPTTADAKKIVLAVGAPKECASRKQNRSGEG